MALTLSGCFPMIKTLPPNNAAGPTFERLPDPESLLVGLAVSGGGNRAATFAAGALEALAQMRVSDGGRQGSVLERVNYISSVSGGSLASAYYVMQKPPKAAPVLDGGGLSAEYRKFFRTFEDNMQLDFQRPAALRQLLTLRALNSTKAAYSLSEVWDGMFFRNATFVELYEREKRGDSPRLILNGTRWNDGRRFVFTTLPIEDFEPNFARGLLQTFEQSEKIPNEEKALIRGQLQTAYQQFRPISFQNMSGDSAGGSDFRTLNLSVAVASSASFPGLIGPVTYNTTGSKMPYHHIGDGGLFDNQGTESLVEIFLHKLDEATSAQRKKKALIIIVDAAFPFDAEKGGLDASDTSLDVLKADPLRVQGVMEQRALAYQLALWSILRSQQVPFLPDFDHLRIVHLRHTDAKWQGFDELPEACRGEFQRNVTSDEINRAIAAIPTLLRIKTPCHGVLLIEAAHKVVNQNRDRIVGFVEAAR
jgi:predicted acylesterase/phospholipase RssA